MRVLMSLAWAPTIDVASGTYAGCEVTVSRRSYDWQVSGLKLRILHLRGALQILREARDYDVLILATCSMEAFFVARLRDIFCPRVTLMGVDLLMPRPSRQLQIVGSWLGRMDSIGCIRRGDIKTFAERFGIPAEKCFFLHFPAGVPKTTEVCQGDYVYSGGAAHRDWATLISALEHLPFPARLSIPEAMEMPDTGGRVQNLGLISPEEGRKLAGGAALVALAFVDTTLPSGPLVLLDAMAMGKAVVTSDVNGTRDYVIPGETALMVPPGDPNSLKQAIASLMSDPAACAEMGQRAQQDVRKRFTLDNFMAELLGEAKKCHAARSGRNKR